MAGLIASFIPGTAAFKRRLVRNIAMKAAKRRAVFGEIRKIDGEARRLISKSVRHAGNILSAVEVKNGVISSIVSRTSGAVASVLTFGLPLLFMWVLFNSSPLPQRPFFAFLIFFSASYITWCALFTALAIFFISREDNSASLRLIVLHAAAILIYAFFTVFFINFIVHFGVDPITGGADPTLSPTMKLGAMLGAAGASAGIALYSFFMIYIFFLYCFLNWRKRSNHPRASLIDTLVKILHGLENGSFENPAGRLRLYFMNKDAAEYIARLNIGNINGKDDTGVLAQSEDEIFTKVSAGLIYVSLGKYELAAIHLSPLSISAPRLGGLGRFFASQSEAYESTMESAPLTVIESFVGFLLKKTG